MEINVAFQHLAKPPHELTPHERDQAWGVIISTVERAYQKHVHAKGGELNQNEEHRADVQGRVLEKLVQRWREGRLKSSEGGWTKGRATKYINKSVERLHIDIIRSRKAEKRNVERTVSLNEPLPKGGTLQDNLADTPANAGWDDPGQNPEFLFARKQAREQLEAGRELLEALAELTFKGVRPDWKTTRSQAFSQMMRRAFDGHDMHRLLQDDEGIQKEADPAAWTTSQAKWLRTHSRVRSQLKETLDTCGEKNGWSLEQVERCGVLLTLLDFQGA